MIVGLTTARNIWAALEAAYSNSSVERVQNLRDQLRQTQKGPTFETFSTSFRSSRPQPTFSDLLARAESHELFIKALHGSSPPTVSFSAQSSQHKSGSNTMTRGRGNYNNRGGYQNSRGNYNNQGGRRPPHCQLCRTQGHYASSCPKLASNVASATPIDDTLAHAFHAQCHVSSAAPDWYVDSGASDHMTTSSDSVSNPKPPTGNKIVYFGNGNSLAVSHIGDVNLLDSIKLPNVLVVSNLTKNLLSVSKPTEDNGVDVLFSHPYFYIQDRQTTQVLAQGCRKDGLYVLHTCHEPLVATSSCPKASYEMCSNDNQISTLLLTTFSDKACTNVLIHSPNPSTIKPTLTSAPCKLCMDSPSDTSLFAPIDPITPSSDHNHTPTDLPPINQLPTPITSPPPPPHINTQPTPPPPPPAPTHLMMTRAKSSIFKPRHQADLSHTIHSPLHDALFASTDPKTYKTAAKDSKWVAAI
uniref:Retrovirus-related Pol polyprotein from transposon TNT 1-94 n=1 Tax=Tanacetum cinerariifolium TaxID=118510 RepID=A0A6L2LVL0_TANCI|nr:retrovirus-related Pol polyprotein from transposon TNT 1-94 [Tanacetum cinerariifolium]